jgi:pimeloyl-ACP methyl ester carboxylesterase
LTSAAPTAHGRVICIHGAGSGPWVFAGWAVEFPQWEVVAPDLQEGLDLATASMADYAAAVQVTSEGAGDVHTVLCGWSMGGLLALMAVNTFRPAAVVILEPSLPAELKQTRSDAAPMPGTFDPADATPTSRNEPRARDPSASVRRNRSYSFHRYRKPPRTNDIHPNQ